MDWLGKLGQIEALEDAEIDASLVDLFELSASLRPARIIRFSNSYLQGICV